MKKLDGRRIHHIRFPFGSAGCLSCSSIFFLIIVGFGYLSSLDKRLVAAQNKVLEAMYLLSEQGYIVIPCEADDEV